MIPLAWRIAIATTAIVAAAGGGYLFGNLTGRDAVEDDWHAQQLADERASGDDRVASERRISAATAAFADRAASLEPVILRSTNTVTRYAQTPAGAAPCLPAERVLGIDADRAALFPARADAAADALPADADRNPG